MNHLAGATSPYLLQHAENAVDWYPWGPEALARARAEHKPIFLSIGYAACHWCHVMAHESFEDQATADILNEHFISIKVDREERPDLDSIYMQATQALTGSGGWPMSVFLTTDLRPFYAGTYFPPVPRFNMPSFQQVLLGIVQTWREEPEEIERVSGQLLQHLQPVPLQSAEDAQPFADRDLELASANLLELYDWGYGGWGAAPKFPQPMSIEFLFRRSRSNSPQSAKGLEAALHALEAMARGGMYDVVGGGFSRYSTDQLWRVPHFEKMLYDNAQLALAYLHAWQITHKPGFKRIVIEVLDFVAREMTDSGGGFYSSLDADSEGEEGKYYVWTRDELRTSLGNASDFEFFSAAYGITERGNWEGKTVLQRAMDDASLAVRSKLDESQVTARLAEGHARLLAARGRRARPRTDDKVLTAWNGFVLQALAEAGRYLDEPEKRAAYLDMAMRNAEFLLGSLRVGHKLRRAWRAGQVSQEVFLEDYASLILGLLALYESDFNNRWFTSAQSLAEEMIADFSDPRGGFFDTPGSGEALLVRPKDLQDNATPSGNALACDALLKLYTLTDHGRYRDLAEKALRLTAASAVRYPTAFARWLSAASYALAPVQQVALVFENAQDPGAQSLLNVLRGQYRPDLLVAAGPVPTPADSPALMQDRPLKGGRTTAYVCQQFVCKRPVNTPEELRMQLEGMSGA